MPGDRRRRNIDTSPPPLPKIAIAVLRAVLVALAFCASAGSALAEEDTSARVGALEFAGIERVEIEQAQPPRIPDATRRGMVDGLPLTIGRPFGVEHYRSAKAELLRRLAEAGHPEPAFQGGADIDIAEHTARVSWQVDAGPRGRDPATGRRREGRLRPCAGGAIARASRGGGSRRS